MSRLQVIIAIVFFGLVCWWLYPKPGRELPQGVTEIAVWLPLGEDVTFRAAVQGFEDRNPQYRVVMGNAAVQNATGDPTRFLLGVAGNVPPDVIHFDRFAVTEWAARGAFRPLDDLIERDKAEIYGVRPEDYYGSAWDETVYKGQCFAIPNSIDTRALYYNKDAIIREGYVWAENDPQVKAGLAQAGDARPPQNWEDLEEYAIKLTRRDSKGQMTTLGFAPNYGNSWLYIYGWQNGGMFMSPDGTKCMLNDERIVEALAYLTRVYDRLGGAQQVLAFQSSFQGGPLDPFLIGDVAMKIDGDWFLNTIATYRKELNFGVCPAPIPQKRLDEGAQPIGWSGGFAYAIPSTAKHPDAAWELIKWLSCPKANEVRLAQDRQQARSFGRLFIPRMHPNKNITLERIAELKGDPTLPDRIKQGYMAFIDLLPRSKFRPVTPVGQKLWNEHARALDRGMLHDVNLANPPTDQDALRLEEARVALTDGTIEVQRDLDIVLNPPQGRPIPWTLLIAIYLSLILAVIFGIWIWNFKYRPVGGYFRRQWYAGWLCAAPWIIGFVALGGGPMIFSIIMSFCHYDVLNPSVPIGVENYRRLFTEDPLFTKSLLNTLFMVIGVPLGLIVGLAIALLLNQEIRGMSAYRTLFYLPAIVPTVASSLLWIWMFEPTRGLINLALQSMGFQGPMWLQDKAWAKPALILMGLWGAGGGMVIWLAGLKGIPKHLYEAAAIDGAGALGRFYHVTMPMLTPYIFFNLVMGLIGTFQVFDQAYVMTSGGPADSTLFYVYALFNQAFRYLHMGYASAMAWFLFVIIMILTAIQLTLSKYWVHYETT
ncbi:MAG TPA: extracellular solute-binding protein [Candidatus Brocadiia bacterium]|nr:extracellular solute-binding protein [Candidatus Brocadiia bacterium]